MTIEDMKQRIEQDNNNLTSTIIQEENETTGPLQGYGITVKECICIKGVESTAGSGILKDYIPPFNATVIEKLKSAGATLLAKTAQDEFGFGGFSTNIGKGHNKPTNPIDNKRSCGGSSGGSAGITKVLKGHKHIAIAESTGGSIASPAAFCGVIGLTPTYGLVSRYGLIDYGNSLDKIGPMTTTIQDAAKALTVIAGHDDKDSTSIKKEPENYEQNLSKDIKGKKIGLITSLVERSHKEVQQAIQRTIQSLQEKGAIIENIELPIIEKVGITTYYLLAMCEASTNLAKYCGIRYGPSDQLQGGFNEYFTKIRSTHLGEEAKRRVLLGTFARMAGFRDAYYLKALKVRRKIIQEYKDQFKKYDAIISPTMPTVAPTFEDIEKLTPMQHYNADMCIAPINLAGLPHISIPIQQDTLPIGLLITADHFQEQTILNIAYALEAASKARNPSD